jgi:hypothetical protein
MPRRELTTLLDDVRTPQLRERLSNEFRNPREDEPEPVFIEDHTPVGTRLYVIWSAWGDLNQRQRSEIIMDAFREARPQPEVFRVTVAMGLTPDEARQMGVRYH